MTAAMRSESDAPQRVSLAFWFLNGVYFAASRTGDRWEPEWPPHFGRAFNAIVAAHYRRTGLDDRQLQSERAALLAIEKLSAPMIFAPDAAQFQYPKGYVPPNHFAEKSGPNLLKMLPGHPKKNKERDFPGFTIRSSEPHIDIGAAVHFVWEHDEAEIIIQHSSAITQLLRRVIYLGTSRSLVTAEVCTTPPCPTFVPLDANEPPSANDVLVRIAGPGRLEALEHHFRIRKQMDVPPVGQQRRYRRTQLESVRSKEVTPVESCFGDMVVFQLAGQDWIGLSHALLVTNRFREAAFAHAGSRGRPASVSGHGEPHGNRPEHVAWIPLPNIDHQFATGRIQGVAAVLPRSFTFGTQGRSAILAALGSLASASSNDAPTLLLGRLGKAEIRVVSGIPDQRSLCTDRFSDISRYWTSITPFVSEFLGTRDNSSTRRLVRRSCRLVGLPDPVDCALVRVSPIKGVPVADAFVTVRKQDQPAYRAMHVLLDFGRPVRGPVLIGRNRYFGMGCCIPWRPDGVEVAQ